MCKVKVVGNKNYFPENYRINGRKSIKMICYAILRGHYLFMEGEYPEHDKKINGN